MWRCKGIAHERQNAVCGERRAVCRGRVPVAGDAQRIEGQAFVNTGHSSAPTLTVEIVSFSGLDPLRTRVANFAFPEHRLCLESIHEIVGRLKRSSAIRRGSGCEHNRLSRGDLSATVDNANVTDVKSLRRFGGELRRMSFARAEGVGAMHGWRSAMPVTQWAVTKEGAS